MRTTSEVVAFIRGNPPLVNLIEGSRHVNAEYKPRSKRRSQSGLAMRHFWESEDGREFRFRFEMCAGGEKAAGLLRGAGAKVKSAVFTVIIEYRHKEGIDA